MPAAARVCLAFVRLLGFEMSMNVADVGLSPDDLGLQDSWAPTSGSGGTGWQVSAGKVRGIICASRSRLGLSDSPACPDGSVWDASGDGSGALRLVSQAVVVMVIVARALIAARAAIARGRVTAGRRRGSGVDGKAGCVATTAGVAGGGCGMGGAQVSLIRAWETKCSLLPAMRASLCGELSRT